MYSHNAHAYSSFMLRGTQKIGSYHNADNKKSADFISHFKLF